MPPSKNVIEVYSKDGCLTCDLVFSKLDKLGEKPLIRKLGVDFDTPYFKKKFPDFKEYPVVRKNGILYSGKVFLRLGDRYSHFQ